MDRRVILALLIPALGCATLSPKFETGPPNDRIAYAVAGEGPVTVVLESGLGDGMDKWEPVFGRISAFTRTVAYDRPGYGGSAAVSGPRTGRDLVGGLRTLLERLDLEPPYVLVGHSLGGQTVELYARLHPGEVGGVVLIDSRHPEFTRRCEEAIGRGCVVEGFMKLLMPGNMKRELEGAEKTADQIREAPPFPDIELAVISRGTGKESKQSRELWAETQADYLRLSARSTHIVSRKSGHYVHHDDPDAVVEAIRRIVEHLAARLEMHATEGAAATRGSGRRGGAAR